MYKAFHVAFSIAMLTILGISEVPVSANCQMAYGSFLAKGCAMPCCKTTLPMPSCPFLKKAHAPRDSITSSVPSLENKLQPLHPSGRVALPTVRTISEFVSALIGTVQLIISGPPPSVRGPPSNAQLLDA